VRARWGSRRSAGARSNAKQPKRIARAFEDANSLDERRHFGEFYEQLLNDLQSAGNAGEYYTPRAVTAFMADRIDPHPGEILLDPACGTGGFLTCAINHMRKHYVKRPEHEGKMQVALRAVEKKQLPHMLCVTNMLLHGVDPNRLRSAIVQGAHPAAVLPPLENTNIGVVFSRMGSKWGRFGMSVFKVS
jgi:type I restriction-modification system DNA methylase subunit